VTFRSARVSSAQGIALVGVTLRVTPVRMMGVAGARGPGNDPGRHDARTIVSRKQKTGPFDLPKSWTRNIDAS
jgi:hypothetical protein